MEIKLEKERIYEQLEFEGEYLNGERNGKGKEYDYTGDILFEGEYLNEKKWNGKGKEYYPNKKLKYEGEYFNRKKWKGIIKEYFDDEYIDESHYYIGQLRIEKEYINGKISKMKEYNDYQCLLFEGECLNEEINGKGKEYYNDEQLKFEGVYLNGKQWNGK